MFRSVLALPKASKIGFASSICVSRVPTRQLKLNQEEQEK